MTIKEIPSASGDIRRMLAESMYAVKTGSMKASDGLALAAIAKEINGSLQVELNVIKVHMQLRKEGLSHMKIANMGKLEIGDDSPALLDGRVQDES